jgi:hypothetical protein
LTALAPIHVGARSMPTKMGISSCERIGVPEEGGA